MAFLKFP